MNTSHKGRRAEHRARALLQALGFAVIRAAGSKGPADLVALDQNEIRFISVKSGTKYLSEVERETFRKVPIPPNGSRWCWRFPNRSQPLIERL